MSGPRRRQQLVNHQHVPPPMYQYQSTYGFQSTLNYPVPPAHTPSQFSYIAQSASPSYSLINSGANSPVPAYHNPPVLYPAHQPQPMVAINQLGAPQMLINPGPTFDVPPTAFHHPAVPYDESSVYTEAISTNMTSAYRLPPNMGQGPPASANQMTGSSPNPFRSPNFHIGNSSSSSPGPSGTLNRQLPLSSSSAGHSPKPSTGRTRLQTFVFPRPQGRDDAKSKSDPAYAEVAGVTEGADQLVKPETSAKQAEPAETPLSPSWPNKTDSNLVKISTLPSKPPAINSLYAAGASGYANQHSSAVSAIPGSTLNPPFTLLSNAVQTQVRQSISNPMQRLTHLNQRRSDGVPVFAQPRYGSTHPSQNLASVNPHYSKPEISLRYPILPQIPARPDSPPLPALHPNEDIQNEELPTYSRYVASLKEIISVYEKRDEMLRLRTEAVGFNPKKAWLAWEKGLGDNEDQPDVGGQQEISTETSESQEFHPILGVRLLQRVAKLTEENDELEKLLQSQLGLENDTSQSEWEKERQEMMKEIQDSHRLVHALDEALSKTESRAVAAERALEAACINNSTSIVPSSSSPSLSWSSPSLPTKPNPTSLVEATANQTNQSPQHTTKGNQPRTKQQAGQKAKQTSPNYMGTGINRNKPTNYNKNSPQSPTNLNNSLSSSKGNGEKGGRDRSRRGGGGGGNQAKRERGGAGGSNTV